MYLFQFIYHLHISIHNLRSFQEHYYKDNIQKNQDLPMKEQQRKHPTINIKYKQFLFTISQPKPGKIAIKFEDTVQYYCYSTEKILNQISFKTVVQALRQSEPHIINAILVPRQKHGYEMRIKVSLEYVNEIQQIFIFEGVKMSEELIKNFKKGQQIKKQVNSLKQELRSNINSYIINGSFSNKIKKNHQFNVEVPYDMTVFSINFTFKNLTSNIINVGFYYFDALTNQKVSENLLPDQLYFAESSDIVVLGEKSRFKRAVISVEGEFQEVNYSVKIEKVVDHTPLDKWKIFLRVLTIAFCICVIYAINQMIGTEQKIAQI